MQASTGEPSMGCFTEEDLDTMFNLYDKEKCGSLPAETVIEVLRELGCSPGKEEEVVEGALEDAGASMDKEAFMALVRTELQNAFAAR
mmetsp:Transcript_86227/g.248869  ORF Transcript_86227/g.248869 Transcript_86227/m.248869 type:complete len:88 (+) Transcript_86227:504-767(+)